MSDHGVWVDLPSGRRLDEPGFDPNYQGSVGPLRRAHDANLRLARRNLKEIAADDIVGEGLYLNDATTGEEFEVVTSYIDLVDPEPSGAVAFCVRDSLLVPLRPRGWSPPVESHRAGEIYGRKAGPTDRPPNPEGKDRIAAIL